ncbi:uncharacterized protein E0L32_006003 [Thyridium curvatum]|uniref:Dehydrogenase FUB6 n=1 Tax=Thyridium curvatum TaxID=1093900 RepID=A0A507AU75_9PEZI|nr:uncharacterized protein E0L32_006003 [Thyridium curvatum]TPX13532.1 hypothetical protein E0L32_006003 [Thyridium curvatum]
MTRNKTFIFKSPPTGYPVPGEHITVEDRPVDTSSAPAGGVLAELLYASYDPYLRGRMRDPKIPSYSPPFQPDAPVVNDTVVRVLKSDSPEWKEGDLAIAFLPIAEYARLDADALKAARFRRVTNDKGLDLAVFLGPLGMPGLTGYAGLHRIGKPKKGETVFVSSAAGAVGQVVGQVAKREGLRVIGSVGSDDKLKFITEELGFDGGFNYKTEKPGDALKRLAPEGIDIYFENVGGEQLEAAIDNMKQGGRIPICGMISDYNTPPEKRYGIKNLHMAIARRITLQGFMVGDKEFGPAYYQEHQENVGKWITEGSFHPKIYVTEGIDNAAEGFVNMLKGGNFGKAVLKIKAE